jgi:hypothetical protein
MKKSGLADSPFFRTPLPPESNSEGGISPLSSATVPVFIDEQTHERTDAQPNDHTPAQMNERTTTQLHDHTDAQIHNRTDAQSPNRATTQLHERTLAQPERPRTRESYDIYEDQDQTIEELRLKWSKARKKHITKGQVMRELLDEILPKHQ